MTRPTASVILSTYNQPEWLELALRGYAAQTRHDFDVIIADDGSRDDTRERIERLKPILPFELTQVWHKDDGFRKCVILNRAIEAALTDYLIFSDGDCIPRRDFVAAHLALRRPQRFLSGGYCKLSQAASRAIAPDDVAAGRATDPAWLAAHGMPGAGRMLKLSARGTTALLLNALTPARASWNGHNASGWKSDLVAVNGFDERMQYGGEDRELGERLEWAGVRGKRVRYQAVVVHLDHERGYVTAGMVERNRAIRAATRNARATWTHHGLSRGGA